jgi:hypothetical protein
VRSSQFLCVEGHGGGKDQGVLMASLTTIYRNKNSHSHMIKSHDWVKQKINTLFIGRLMEALLDP